MTHPTLRAIRTAPGTRHLLRVAAALVCCALAALIPAGRACGQAAEPVPMPVDYAAAIKWRSRVIHHWYPQEKLHAFVMVDGFRIEQGGWRLAARDGIIWLDESGGLAEGWTALDVYAEEGVTITGPDGTEPVETNAVFLRLWTRGELERAAEEDEGDRDDVGGTPLYLRGKQVRQRTLRRWQTEGPPPLPRVADDVEREPAQTLPFGGDAPPPAVIVRPIDTEREVRVVSYLESPERRVTVRTGGAAIVAGDIEMRADEIVIWTNEGEARREDGLEAEVYLEGNVVLSQGYQTVNASRIYYDMDRRRALIADARIRTYSEERQIPVYYTAERAWQLGPGQFFARNATLTTSEMGVPHTAMHGREMSFSTADEPDPETGEPRQVLRYEVKDMTGSVLGMPFTWWPYAAGEMGDGDTALRRVRLSQKGNRGTGLETQWNAWKLLGLYRAPEGFKSTYLNLDYYSKRGPLVGAESRYAREDFYGELLATYVQDHGTDRINGMDVDPGQESRGRFLARHRHFLPQQWQITFEASYLSDDTFLQEWYEEEFKQGKDQETLVHLKKQWGRNAVSILVKGRINDFLTQTGTLPRVEYHLIGEPLLDRLTYHTTNTYAYAEFAPATGTGNSSPWTHVADTRHEVSMPLEVVFAKVVPFVEGRASYFSELTGSRGGDSDYRLYGAGGLRASWYLWKVYEGVHSDLWDLNRLRHVNTFDVEAMIAGTDLASRVLYPFDEPGSAETRLVRGIDKTDVYRVGWRQRWQTQRGPQRKTVDWITLDMLMTWFADDEGVAVSPDDDLTRDKLEVDYAWQLSDTTSVVGDVLAAPGDGGLREANAGVSVIRSPRFSYYAGARYLEGADSMMATLGLDYVINRKWRVHLFQQVDFDQGENTTTRVDLIRRLGNWLMTVRVELDPGEDANGVFLQLQPLGVPEFRIGN